MRTAAHEMPAQAQELGLPKKKNPALIEAAVVAALCVIVYLLAGYLDLLERFYSFSRGHEDLELDEIATVGIFLMFYFMVLALRKWRHAAEANRQLKQANQELRQAAKEIKTLQGMIPICARCKNMRDDEGYWQKVEEYLLSRAEVSFTHGLCPECFAILYPDLAAAQPEKFQQAGGSKLNPDS